MLEWTSESEFSLRGVDFVIGSGFKPGFHSRENQFRLLKPAWMVEQYVNLVAPLRPRNIIELGMYQGGSVALLTLLADPQKLVAVDLRPGPSPLLDRFVSERQLADRVRPYWGVDQSDVSTVREIVEREFDDEPLDLVVDDASHLFEPTSVSFNTLFPRLRPGGIYVVEDWSAGVDLEKLAAIDPEIQRRLDERSRDAVGPAPLPLAALVLEIVLASAYAEWIADVFIRPHWLEVRRGDAPIPDASTFNISDRTMSLGRRLLNLD